MILTKSSCSFPGKRLRVSANVHQVEALRLCLPLDKKIFRSLRSLSDPSRARNPSCIFPLPSGHMPDQTNMNGRVGGSPPSPIQ